MNRIPYNKLRGKIAEKGLTYKDLAEKTNIPVSTLSNKVNGITEFKTSEIIKIADVLEIDDYMEYFF